MSTKRERIYEPETVRGNGARSLLVREESGIDPSDATSDCKSDGERFSESRIPGEGIGNRIDEPEETLEAIQRVVRQSSHAGDEQRSRAPARRRPVQLSALTGFVKRLQRYSALRTSIPSNEFRANDSSDRNVIQLAPSEVGHHLVEDGCQVFLGGDGLAPSEKHPSIADRIDFGFAFSCDPHRNLCGDAIVLDFSPCTPLRSVHWADRKVDGSLVLPWCVPAPAFEQTDEVGNHFPHLVTMCSIRVAGTGCGIGLPL